MVPSLEPCGKQAPGIGLFEGSKLIDNNRRRRPAYPCPACNKWQNVDCLLRHAPAARPVPIEALIAESAEVKSELARVHPLQFH